MIELHINKLFIVFTFVLIIAATPIFSLDEPAAGVSSISEIRDPFEMVDLVNAAKDITADPQQTDANSQETTKVIPERHLESVMLKFLRVENILPVVKNLLSPYGAASTDINTNTLIICDTRQSLDSIIVEIRKADQTPKQVLIEVVIVDVQLSNDTELGVNWDNLFKDAEGNFLGRFSYAQNLTSLTSGGSLTLINGRVETTVKALQKERDTEILASPRVLVLSGQSAYLETIEEIPYTDLTQTGSGGGVDNPIASTEFKDAGITLTVKPTITDEGKILLEVEPNQSINTGVAGVGNTNVPVIDKRTVKTTLLMDAGQVMVIGGLRNKDVRITNDKIPLLGDLPLIGGLFSNDKEVIEHSELLIMISPHIYENDIPLTSAEHNRWQQVQSLDPVELKRKVRPEYDFIGEVVPQIKREK